MQCAILLTAEAAEDLQALPAHLRSAVRNAMETHLRHEPTRLSRSRVKRLRGLSRPQYRLRVDAVRVFYDVAGGEVQVLAIVEKSSVGEWLRRMGVPS